MDGLRGEVVPQSEGETLTACITSLIALNYLSSYILPFSGFPCCCLSNICIYHSKFGHIPYVTPSIPFPIMPSPPSLPCSSICLSLLETTFSL